jgi:arylsulfatase A-like enzyme
MSFHHRSKAGATPFWFSSSKALPLLVAVLSMVLLLGATPSAWGANDDVGPPNIVYILADDLGYGDLSCYGQTILQTPHLDRMAEEGIRFTQHYAGSTVCAPSRCSLLTGLHTGHARIRNNRPGVLKASDVTIAKLLSQRGYRTGCAGKWGVGNPPPLDDPNRMGFDDFFGYISMWHAHNFYPEFLVENGKKVPLENEVPDGKWQDDGRGVATRKVQYAPNLITEHALDFIRAHQEGPFFLYFAMNVPHANNEAGRKGMEVPDWGRFAERDWPEPEKGFAAMIRNIDRDVGAVLDLLRELGIEKNTLVIFTSDNGPHQEGGHQADFFDSNGPLRGIKRDVYDGGIRVPMIAWWPGTIAPKQTSEHISAFYDMMPTFCELAKVDIPEQTDGISLVPTLLGEKENQREHDFLFWQFDAVGGKQAVRLGPWKGVRTDTMQDPAGPIELYHIATDIGEENEVSRRHPEVVREIRKIMSRENTEPLNWRQ